jgi:hypothetical protein
VPDDLGSKWRAGSIRARKAWLMALAPPNQPGVVTDAPALVESQSAEAAISLKEDCADRNQRLRVTFDASGETKPFYLCFSDNGGTVRYSVTSGVKAIDPSPQLTVEAEPRLLRVRQIEDKVQWDSSGYSNYPINVFEVSAYNADRQRISMPVDFTISDSSVLKLVRVSDTTADQSTDPLVVQATPMGLGTAELHVMPGLLDKPECVSPTVTVVPLGTLP